MAIADTYDPLITALNACITDVDNEYTAGVGLASASATRMVRLALLKKNLAEAKQLLDKAEFAEVT